MSAAPPRPLLGFTRIGLAAICVTALVRQYTEGTGRPTFEPLNFFSFFTIESNLLAAVVLLLAGACALRGHRPGWLDGLRGAATLYMTTTGIVYVLLLRGLEESLQTPLPWVNAVLHYVMPVAMVADWVLDAPGRRLTMRDALPWLGFPVAYVAYSLIRGSVVDWYPYPFLDADANGYAAVLVASVGIALAMLALAWLVAWRSRMRKFS